MYTRRTHQKTLNCTKNIKTELGLVSSVALETLKHANANKSGIKNANSFLLWS